MNLQGIKREFSKALLSMSNEDIVAAFNEMGIDVDIDSDERLIAAFDDIEDLQEGYKFQRDRDIVIGERLIFEFGAGHTTTITNMGKCVIRVINYNKLY